MRPAYIPEVPQMVTREQLIEAIRALGLEPYTVESLTIDAYGVDVGLVVYNTPDPDLTDEHAFRPSLSGTPARVSIRIPVEGSGVMPV